MDLTQRGTSGGLGHPGTESSAGNGQTQEIFPSWAEDVLHRRLSSRRIKDQALRQALEGRSFLLFDGAMGTQLQARGLDAGSLPELLCLEAPAEITQIHRAYVEAGAQVITTNTFGANAHKLGEAASVEQVFKAAVACARAAGAAYVAADLGPTGSLLQPMGTLSFDEAYGLYAQQAKAASAAGADLFIIETMTDLSEMKAALLAVRDHTDLPALCTMTFAQDGRTFLGTTPEIAAVTLCALGADALGINCSLGPDAVAPLVQRMLPWASCPVMAQANAGLPQMKDGKTVYTVDPAQYRAAVAGMVQAGVSIVGGCCGTTPEHILALADLLSESRPQPRQLFTSFSCTSAQDMVDLRQGQVGIIGERINPTGKRKLKEALRSGSYDYVLGEALSQQAAGAQILDVNAGLPEIDERAVLQQLVMRLQSITTLPLQIDATSPAVIEAAVRSYVGKPIVNSVNGTAAQLETILPLIKKYGCAFVALALDDKGIPETAQGRADVAGKIIAAAEELGIPHHDIAVDCLAMAASTDQRAPGEILAAIRLVKERYPGVRCVLGVSNISFGLPCRDLINANFLTAAFGAGLDLAIINPLSPALRDAVASWRVLSGEDAQARSFIAHYASCVVPGACEPGALGAGSGTSAGTASAASPAAAAPSAFAASADSTSAPAGAAGTAGGQGNAASPASTADQVRTMVLEGRKDPVPGLIATMLESEQVPALDIINSTLVPALDEVGERFERGVFFLPQLMASAEAAKAGFETIKASMASAKAGATGPDGAGGAGDSAAQTSKGTVALCTVRGDIHDIGKNIVRMLLENYGYTVLDLGRDVEPEVFVDAVVKHHVPLAGLSALMTTTVGAMKETVDLLRQRAPWCQVVVGGAVLNKEYARMVGADYYAKDAQAAARICAEVFQA